MGRIHEATGLPISTISKAIDRGQLRTQSNRKDGRPVTTTQDLVAWMEEHSPVYRKEVAHLSTCVSSKVAGKLSGLGQTSVVKALRAGEMKAIQTDTPTGPRYYIPRRNFDLWLQSRGLPPSWQLESDSEWLSVALAAALSGVAVQTIQKWCNEGKISRQRRGRHWLVGRQSMLDQTQLYRNSLNANT